jgi:cathepsin A (carboxypeptidase C)
MKYTFFTILWCAVAPVNGALHASPRAANKFFSGHSGVPDFTLRLGSDTARVCNSSTPGTSGLIETKTDESSIFFWAYESKNDPKRDPVILWMTGYVYALILLCSSHILS